MPSAASPTRRTLRREATLGEIRDTARTLLAEAGPDAVTLRGIATRLGMAPAGVHYYYSSRDELVTALIVDAFTEHARATSGAPGPVAARRPRSRGASDDWIATALRYRAWALDNPEQFQLAHSTTATRLKDRPGLLDSKNRAVRALIDPLIAAIARGDLEVPFGHVPIGRDLRGQLKRYAEVADVPSDPRVQLYLLQAYTLVHGAVMLALTGGLPAELLENDSLFRAQLAQIAAP